MAGVLSEEDSMVEEGVLSKDIPTVDADVPDDVPLELCFPPKRRVRSWTASMASTRSGLSASSESLPEIGCSATRVSLPPLGQTLEVLPEVPDLEEWSGKDSGDKSASQQEADANMFRCRYIQFEKGNCWGTRMKRLNAYHVGKPLRFHSDSAGKMIDAVVVDSNGDQVKVLYFLGNRGFTKVLALNETEDDPYSDFASKPLVGAPVMVRSSSINTWFKGTIVWCQGDQVKVHFWHNGQSCTKITPKTSPDLRVLRRLPIQAFNASPVAPAASGHEEKLKVGMFVTCTGSGGNLFEGVVTDIKGQHVKVSFCRGNRCFAKNILASAVVAEGGISA